jgi:hypothetical protein
VLVAKYLERWSSGSLHGVSTRSLQGHASSPQWRDESADRKSVHLVTLN